MNPVSSGPPNKSSKNNCFNSAKATVKLQMNSNQQLCHSTRMKSNNFRSCQLVINISLRRILIRFVICLNKDFMRKILYIICRLSLRTVIKTQLRRKKKIRITKRTISKVLDHFPCCRLNLITVLVLLDPTCHPVRYSYI